MRAITIDELLTKEEYERQRPEIRRRVMTLKARRRVPLGDHATPDGRPLRVRSQSTVPVFGSCTRQR